MKGWPIIGATPQTFKRMGDGKTGKDSFFYELHERYGPTLRLKGIGELALCKWSWGGQF